MNQIMLKLLLSIFFLSIFSVMCSAQEFKLDSTNSFLYLYDRIDINSVDYKNNTPLDLASYYGSENVI